jgi:hypothetical protein
MNDELKSNLLEFALMLGLDSGAANVAVENFANRESDAEKLNEHDAKISRAKHVRDMETIYADTVVGNRGYKDSDFQAWFKEQEAKGASVAESVGTSGGNGFLSRLGL